MPGTVIAGKYRIERGLAAGGSALVFEALHVELGQRVAIKILRGESGRGSEVIERFRREAQIAAQLPPEHVARVTDVGQTESGEPFLVMELLIGNDLEAELNKRGRVPPAEAVDLVLQACAGVAEAHAVGLVHRDLKPGNLFVTRLRDGSSRIKVLDFGISKATRGIDEVSLTTTTANFGTPLYMSPEQIQSTKNVDARCDQHALGAIVFALIAGRPPFVAETVTALAVVIATKNPVSLRELVGGVDPALDAAVLRALAKRPEDRFPSLVEFARAIAPFGTNNAAASVRAIEHALGQPREGNDAPRFVTAAPPAAAANAEVMLAHDPSRPSAEVLSRTVPLAPAPTAQMAHTASGITTSIPGGRARRLSMLAALVMAAVALTIGVGAWSFRKPDRSAAIGSAAMAAAPNSGGASAPASAPESTASVAIIPEPSPPAPLAPPPLPGGAAAASTASAPATGTASAPPARKAPTRPQPHRAQPQPSAADSSPIEVFRER